MVYGELGRFPLYITRYGRIIKFWLKVVNSDNNKLIKVTYNRQSNWAMNVKNLLFTTGFGDVWLAQGVANERVFLKQFKLRLRDMYMQDWRGTLYNKPKCRSYCHYVDSLKYHTYLSDIHIEKHRIALSRLRVSAHRLRIETGRWERPPLAVATRKCYFCDNLEDECHFVLECPAYEELRERYIPYRFRCKSMYNFIQLMSSEDSSVVCSLAAFIYKAFELRSNLLK